METTEERLGKLETVLDAEKRFAELAARVSVLEKGGKENQLVVLGDLLRIPMNRVFLVVFVILAVLVAGFIWLLPKEKESEILAVVFLHDKTSQDQAISQIYTLVTPHEETLNDLRDQGAELTDDQVRHYTLDPCALEDFAKELKKEGAQGYSRREVWGEGTQGVKRGWEWTITWSKERPISVRQLLELYDLYFHRKEKVYIKEERVGPTLLSSK